eukprot:gene31175-6318_t
MSTTRNTVVPTFDLVFNIVEAFAAGIIAAAILIMDPLAGDELIFDDAALSRGATQRTAAAYIMLTALLSAVVVENLSSVLVAEQASQVRVFPTILGFKATTGFSLSVTGQDAANNSISASAPSPLSTPLPALPPPHPALDSIQQMPPKSCNSDPNLASSLSKQNFRPPNIHSSSARREVVGWKGLFEISRNSGTSGVMVSRSPMFDREEIIHHQESQLEVCATAHTNSAIRGLVKSVVRGLKACQEPEIPKEGMGGTYFLSNENGRKVAILKPCDEEPLAPNNPKGYVGRALGDPGWKPTVRVGEAAMREVAAYLLDHDHFAKVPTSVLVRARHPALCYNNRMSSVRDSCLDLSAAAAQHDPLPMKLGSLQEFVSHECDTTEMGTSRFSTEDVHRIGILDIRLFNTDRHAGNMLVRSNRESSATLSARMNNDMRELIPIDHGFCLPETLEAPYFEWLHWPQAMQSFSEEELVYIKNLDIEADKELLRKQLPNLRPECLRVLELGTTLLKRGAEEGLNLFEIASIMTRPYGDSDEEPSELEMVCLDVQNMMQASSTTCSEEEDEFDESDSELILDGSCMATPLAAAVHHDGLFELEDVGSSKLKLARARSGEAHSPSQLSESSSSSDGLSDLASCGSRFSSRQLSSGLGGGGLVGAGLGGSGLPKLKPEASVGRLGKSVCGTDGFLYRQMKNCHQGHANRKRHCKTRRAKHSATAYPPPVLAAAPDSSVVSFSDMDEQDWSLFMDMVNQQILEALDGGKFKKAATAFETVSSCPRF